MKLIAKTLFGLEDVLSAELRELGAEGIRTANRAVLFEGNTGLLYKTNYCLRTAMSVLMPVREFRIRSRDDLYRGAASIEWDRYMDADSTFAVVPVVNSPIFEHSGFPALVVKDAIADFFRKVSGRRPSVNTADPGIIVNLHISNELVTISLDSSGEPLYKRGYRKEHPDAPLNEVLAAGIIMISGWNSSSEFLDPMCGSGTFPIEAALLACRVPPGKSRKSFGFQNWKEYDESLFDHIREKADKLIMQSPVKISGSDISEKAVVQSRSNAETAGIASNVTFTTADFSRLRAETESGMLFMNPPYGLRLQAEETDSLYTMIGSTLKHSFAGWQAWLITPNRESLKYVGLKPGKKYSLFNGALECALLRYDLYSGSRKSHAPEA